MPAFIYPRLAQQNLRRLAYRPWEAAFDLDMTTLHTKRRPAC